MKNPKSEEQRNAEADKLWGDVEALGLPEADLDPVRRVLSDFRNGAGFTGLVRLPALNLAMDVKLSLQAHIYGGIRVTSLNPAAAGKKRPAGGQRAVRKPTKAAAAAAEAKRQAAADPGGPGGSSAAAAAVVRGLEGVQGVQGVQIVQAPV